MQPRHITFCLCPQFPLFCIASALEVLRHANRFAKQTIYTWAFLCENDKPIQDTNGLWLHPDSSIEQAIPSDMAFIVAGFKPNDIEVPRIRSWIKKQAKKDRMIGGISNGAFQLAKANLLDGYSATTHWEDFESFFMLYPQVRSRYQRFVIDRNRITCSGGTATLDLFIEIVRQDLGIDIMLQVSRQMLMKDYAPSQGKSQLIFDASHQYSPRVQRALSLLDSGIEHEFNVSSLARQVGISRRELLRLFQVEIGKAPSKILIQRRLERAQSLVLNSHLPLAVISSAVGFSSQSHLTTSYRKYYGITPSAHRRGQRVG